MTAMDKGESEILVMLEGKPCRVPIINETLQNWWVRLPDGNVVKRNKRRHRVEAR